MMQLTEDQRKALAGLCRIEVKRWKTASESNPNMGYMVELMQIALASLTAEPVEYRVLREDGGIAGHFATLEDAQATVKNWNENWKIQPVYTAPPATAPAINLAELVPPEADGSNLPFAAEGWNACRATILRKIEEAQ